jgi:hypothetical protein
VAKWLDSDWSVIGPLGQMKMWLGDEAVLAEAAIAVEVAQSRKRELLMVWHAKGPMYSYEPFSVSLGKLPSIEACAAQFPPAT